MAKAIILRDRFPFGTDAYNKADEHWHQCCFMEFVRMEYPEFKHLVFAIPNGGTRNKVEAQNMKLEGVKAGVPDVFVSVPAYWSDKIYHGMYIEMKRPVGSYGVSEKQTEFMNNARAAGYATGLAEGYMAAIGLWLLYFGRITHGQAANEYGVDFSKCLFGGGFIRR